VSGPSIAEFDPVELGPFEISRIPVSGAIAAAGFLLGLALAVRQVRRAGLPVTLPLELFAAGAPAVLLAARLPALVRAFPAFLHDGRALAAALVARSSITLGLLAALALLAAFAWASRRPARFLDATSPGALVVAASVAAAHRPGREGALLGLAGLVVACAACMFSERLARMAREGVCAGLLAAAASALLLLSLRG
jgi:hypothetical protein